MPFRIIDMGTTNSHESENFVDPIQALLKERGLKISTKTIKTILEDIDRKAPWFVYTGDINLKCWEKLGKDLEQAKEKGSLRAGTFPFWKLVHSCLQTGKNVEIIKQGRRALADQQDSWSEQSITEEREHTKRKGKVKDERSHKEMKKILSSEKEKPSAPLYPALSEFEDLRLAEEEQYEENLDNDFTETEEQGADNKIQAASVRPPPYVKHSKGSHFIKRETWAQLASAFPVFEEQQTQRRFHEPIPYKQLKDLVEAARQFGPNAAYTLTLLGRLTTNAMTPSDWFEIARGSLSTGQYLDYRSIVTDAAHTQARQNVRDGQPHWTADMLLGQGQWAADQTRYPLEVYRQINDIYLRAWKTLPKRGEVSGNLTKIIQGSNEPFSEFVGRMMEAAGKIFGDVESSMPLIQQLIYEQATKDCKRAITPWKGKGLEAWLKACREIGGPLTNAGLAAAILTATKRNNNNGACFKCGKIGHFKKNCKEQKEHNNPVRQIPGTCPRCKKGKHWANECRSVKDINGQPLETIEKESKNGYRGPRPQGPKAYGALQEPSMQPPPKSAEQPRAPQGWTSVPPPAWY